MQQQIFRVDERLQIGSERATVRYVGEVAGQSGEWVGLEWDNESRGKHDGSTNGHRYFSCIYSGELRLFVTESP
jgi:tubulin-specific chaperone E